MKRKPSEVKQKILHMLKYAQRRVSYFPYGLTLRHIAGTTRMSPLEEHRASVAMADLMNSGKVVKTKVDRNGNELRRTHYRLKEEENVWQPVQLKTKEEVVKKLKLKDSSIAMPRLIKQSAPQVTLTVTTDPRTARTILALVSQN